MLVNGFIGLASAISGAVVTEFAGANYARQPVSFGTPRFGMCVNATAWSFWSGLSGTIAGRAVYDAPTGGNLLFTLPFPSGPAPLWRGASDARDVGGLVLTVGAMLGFPDGTAYTGAFAAGDTIGQCWDPAYDKVGTTSTSKGPIDTFNTAVVLAGSPLSVLGGQMFARARVDGVIP